LDHLLQPAQVRALVAAGRLDDASNTAAAMLPGPDRDLAVAAISVAARRFHEVPAALRHRAGWSVRNEVEALVLCAMAATGAEADDLLRTAMDLARPFGLVSPFLDRGEDLDRLIRRASAHRRACVARPEASVGDVARATPAVVEPLTPRERELLRLLPTHLTNAAIGEQLYVSVNTVKTNLRSIYRKLGTSSRAETVVVGRRLGLLPADETVFTRIG
jgi:LuxR family maltose regulon positive regulatory protein